MSCNNSKLCENLFQHQIVSMGLNISSYQNMLRKQDSPLSDALEGPLVPSCSACYLASFCWFAMFLCQWKEIRRGSVYHNGLMIAAIITNKNISLLKIICVNHVHPFLPGRRTLWRKRIVSKERKCSEYPQGWWHQFVTWKGGFGYSQICQRQTTEVTNKLKTKSQLRERT